MKNEKFLISTFLFLLCLFSACEKKATENNLTKPENSKDSSSYSKIEDVDFKNFSYSAFENEEYPFTITNGEKPLGKLDEAGYRLRNIEYRDLTNDSKNEAVVNLQVTHAVSTSSLIFVYTLDNEQPKKLWNFFSGTYANGGLKDVYFEKNNLIVEFFGNTKFDKDTREFEFSNIQKYPEAECCPNKFTKFNFRWNGENFLLTAKPELFDYNWKKENHENLLNRKETKN